MARSCGPCAAVAICPATSIATVVLIMAVIRRSPGLIGEALSLPLLVAIEVLQRSPGSGVISCDGRRTFNLGPGARVEVTKGSKPVKMVTLSDEPFADRLVRKFNLPVVGWRGPGSDA